MSQSDVYEILKKKKGRWLTHKKIMELLAVKGIVVSSSTLTSNVVKVIRSFGNIIEIKDGRARGRRVRMIRLKR